MAQNVRAVARSITYHNRNIMHFWGFQQKTKIMIIFGAYFELVILWIFYLLYQV